MKRLGDNVDVCPDCDPWTAMYQAGFRPPEWSNDPTDWLHSFGALLINFLKRDFLSEKSENIFYW